MAPEVYFERVERALDKVRPFLNDDGGDVRLLEITPAMEAVVELLGACINCPCRQETMQLGIESLIKKEVPEIIRVVNATPN
jgi:Fe-S cluster biogenesis protein NfuA